MIFTRRVSSTNANKLLERMLETAAILQIFWKMKIWAVGKTLI